MVGKGGGGHTGMWSSLVLLYLFNVPPLFLNLFGQTLSVKVTCMQNSLERGTSIFNFGSSCMLISNVHRNNDDDGNDDDN